MGQNTDLKIFRFNLVVEPSHADPAKINSSESNYFLVNIHRGLYFTDIHGDPQPEIAEFCRLVKPKTYRCHIKDQAIWSDGSPITAQDFVESWHRLLAPNAKGLGVRLLTSVRGAVKAYTGQGKLADVGAKATGLKDLEITLEHDDSDFLAKLAQPALAVVKSGYSFDRDSFIQSLKNKIKIPTSGPYQISNWSKANRILLTANKNYDQLRLNVKSKLQAKVIPRPNVEVLIVDDDETAFSLYREGTLSLLRRLPTHYISKWQKSRDFQNIPLLRFDYIGFGPRLKQDKSLREALVKSLKYEELQILYSSRGIPGCPGILPQWAVRIPCYSLDLKRARSLFSLSAISSQASPPKSSSNSYKDPFKLTFSRLGGEDIQKGMEWFQEQWNKHLGLKIELDPREHGVFIASLKKSPPDLFRKGVGLDRASCQAALEIFTKDGGENYVKYDNARYDEIVSELNHVTNHKSKKARELCTEGLNLLIQDFVIIPLGQMHFSILAKPTFVGWHVNPLNQLDLSRLQEAKYL